MSGGWTRDENLSLKGGVDSEDWNKAVLCLYLTELNLHDWIFKKVNGTIGHVGLMPDNPELPFIASSSRKSDKSASPIDLTF